MMRLWILFIFITQTCNYEDMKITVLNEIKIENIPSGSGITKVGDIYYVIGDDSPYLFSLDKDFKIISKTPLLDTGDYSGNRISKSQKPDFEALEWIGENELVVFGSGSKSPERDLFLRVFLGDPLIMDRVDLSDFYSQLKNLPIFEDSELNIEATAYRNNHLYLFNRNKNLIIRFEYSALLAYLKEGVAFPTPEIRQFSLPKINGIEAGFSGATALANESKIIFTASVENTDNAYDDGEIMGSIIGILDISDNSVSASYQYCEIPNKGTPLKVESVTVEKEISSGETKVILISDDDQGNSSILPAIIFW